MTTRPFTIALSGKGGTGKTTISSLLYGRSSMPANARCLL